MSDVERVVLMSGKLFYDLDKERTLRKLEKRVALVRIEEIAPFPFAQLEDTLRPYVTSGKRVEWIWVQEEPRNQGAWSHVKDRLDVVLENLRAEGEVRFVGRNEDVVPAPGIGSVYQVQQRSIITGTFAGL